MSDLPNGIVDFEHVQDIFLKHIMHGFIQKGVVVHEEGMKNLLEVDDDDTEYYETLWGNIVTYSKVPQHKDLSKLKSSAILNDPRVSENPNEVTDEDLQTSQ
jgi:hypothetical protein